MYTGMKSHVYGKVKADFSEADNIPISSFAGAVAIGAVIKSVESWHPNNNQPVPSNYNRHVTAHQISTSRVDRATAIISISLGVSLRTAESNGDFGV